MEKQPYTFKDITNFRFGKEEKRDPRIDYIIELPIEFVSNIPSGKYSLRLIKPFPPLCRAGKKLSTLRSLRTKEIESIQAFRESVNGKQAHLEIRGKAHEKNIVVKCERIEGVPNWD